MRKGICKKGHKLTDENSYFRKDGSRTCKLCAKERQDIQYSDLDKRKEILDNQKKSYNKNIEERRRKNRLNWNKNKVKYNKQQRDSFPEKLRKLKLEVLTHYSEGSEVLGCVCCGEDILGFLTLDHINGREEGDRGNNKKKRVGRNLWAFVKRNGFPKGYQTLCWNCNSGRQINKGICPHKEGERK